jgi:hypothetical protein
VCGIPLHIDVRCLIESPGDDTDLLHGGQVEVPDKAVAAAGCNEGRRGFEQRPGGLEIVGAVEETEVATPLPMEVVGRAVHMGHNAPDGTAASMSREHLAQAAPRLAEEGIPSHVEGSLDVASQWGRVRRPAGIDDEGDIEEGSDVFLTNLEGCHAE